MTLQSFLQEKIHEIKENDLYRTPVILERPGALRTIINGKEVLNLSSNNYLNYADHPEIKKAVIEAIELYGIGATGSRLISGTSPLHARLENKLASFKKTEAAMFLSTGYAANVSTIAALMDKNDVIFSDELNHASIIDGIKLSKAAKFIYNHADPHHLQTLLNEHRHHYKKAMIVTDTIFSMDGDKAPLEAIISLKNRYNSFLMVDEAHATGVFGENGAGIVDELGLSHHVEVQMGTTSKAVGIEGAYIAGSTELIDYLRHKSRGFVFSTAPSIATVAAVLKAIEFVELNKQDRIALWENINFFKHKLFELVHMGNIQLLKTDSAIFCLTVGNIRDTLKFQKKMMDEYSIFLSAIRPPTVATSRIRLCLSAQLTSQDLNYILNAIEQITLLGNR